MVYFLCNTITVSGGVKKAVRKARMQFAGREITLRSMLEIRDYKAFFETLNEGDEVVLFGGDGTLNYLANSTRGYRLPVPVYICKAGTGNDFLWDVYGYNVPNGTLYRINEAMENLPTAEIGGKTYTFVNNLSFGMDGHVCSVAEDMKARGRKRQNYTLIAARLLLTYRCTDADVTVDGVSRHLEKVWLAPAMNGRYFGGGMKMTPDQDRRGHTLTLGIFYNVGRLKAIRLFLKIFKGGHVKYKEHMCFMEGHDIHVRFDEPRDVQMDGEVVRGVTEYRAHKD